MAPPLKTNWPPCVICGTEEGLITGNCKTPERHWLGRFAVYGHGCKGCYNRLLSRVKAGRPAEPWILRRPYTPRTDKESHAEK